MSAGVLIIGGGQAGFQTAASLRQEGYEEPISILCEETEAPYQRPPLSKAYLTDDEPPNLAFWSPSIYGERQVELILGDKATGIDLAGRRVERARGAPLAYDHLVIATGARNRPLPVPGADLDGVLYLRTLAEADMLRGRLREVEHVVVIGGGYIGLEVAASARKLGCSVVVAEMMDRILARVAPPSISEVVHKLHADHGADIRLGAQASEIVGEGGHVRAVKMANGDTLPADLVVVGIGVMPNTEFAEASGLRCANGVVIDSATRCEGAGHVYAIGDCANFRYRFASGPIRLESVQNAADQARCAAKAIVGKEQAYDAVPWFWTIQYDMRLQTAGIAQNVDETVFRGEPGAKGFSAFHYAAGRLVAVDSLDSPADHMAARQMLDKGLSPPRAIAGDADASLKDWLKEASAQKGS